MRLSELDPKLANGFLRFDCPVCSTKGDSHAIRVPLAPQTDRWGQSWHYSGEYPESLTLSPSVDAGCWHGNITNGEIT